MEDLKKELEYQLKTSTAELERTKDYIKRKVENIKYNADRATTAGAGPEIGNYIAQDAANISALLGKQEEQITTLYMVLNIAEAAGIELEGTAKALELARS